MGRESWNKGLNDIEYGKITFDPGELTVIEQGLERRLSALLTGHGYEGLIAINCRLKEFQVTQTEEVSYDFKLYVKFALIHQGMSSQFEAVATRGVGFYHKKALSRLIDDCLEQMGPSFDEFIDSITSGSSV